MPAPNADKDLLFAVLAFQNNFLDRKQLVEAVRGWLPDKSQRLADVLTGRGLLTSDQRLVLRLRFDEDRSLAEIAESLGRSIGSVKALQHRGLSRLAEALADRRAQAFAMV